MNYIGAYLSNIYKNSTWNVGQVRHLLYVLVLIVANRKTILATGEIYHIFNRGVARQPTFINKSDYDQALLSIFYYRVKKPPVKLSKFKEINITDRNKILKEIYSDRNGLVEIISYVLMPNHFHLLIKQTTDNGISTFMSKFTNSYTKYLNTKHNRPGPVFQGIFKSVHVETEEQLIHLSRYIHLNPLVSFVVTEKNFLAYPWSSLAAYFGPKQEKLASEIVLSSFKDRDAYRKFVLDHADYAKQLELIKHLTIAED